MMTQKQQLKLTIELVPSTSWYNNLRKVIPKGEWNKIRKQVDAEYGHKCGVCGTDSGKLNCHEIWEYDDHNHEQRLKGFIPLCDLCHHVKHIGRAGILASEGKLDYEKIVQHFMKVNGCDREIFEKHKEQAFAQWRERSRYEWKVDLGAYKDLVANKRRS